MIFSPCTCTNRQFCAKLYLVQEGIGMIITFFGHDRVPNADKVREWLCHVLAQFVHKEEVICYLGGYGGFDSLAASVVRQKQALHPAIKSILIIPYLNKKYDESGYDYTLFPPLESVPPRYAILKRNEWMISQADIVIAYVTHSWGGAAKALKYAQTKEKKVIIYPETSADNTSNSHHYR